MPSVKRIVLLPAFFALFLISYFFFLALPQQASGHGPVETSVVEIFDTDKKRKDEARSLVRQLRETGAGQTPQDRRQTCQELKPGLQATMDRIYSDLSDRTYALDDIFAAVHDYYDNTPAVQNQDNLQLLWAAEAAYLNAQVEAGALSLLNVNIDCDNPDVSAGIAAFGKTAESSYREVTLYKKALLKLVRALEAP